MPRSTACWRAASGRIVNITSSAVKAPIDILGLSNGARSGLTGFVAGLARNPQIAARGVTINNLLPGKFDTDRLAATFQGAAQKSGQPLEAVRAAQQAQIPARRFGTPAEFGAICAFLCSQQAAYPDRAEHPARRRRLSRQLLTSSAWRHAGRAGASLQPDLHMTATTCTAAAGDDFIENITFDELSLGQCARAWCARSARPTSRPSPPSRATPTGPPGPGVRRRHAVPGRHCPRHGRRADLGRAGHPLPGPGTHTTWSRRCAFTPGAGGRHAHGHRHGAEQDEAKKRVELDCLASNQHGEKVLSGVARVLAPTEKVRQPRTLPLPQLRLFDPRRD